MRRTVLMRLFNLLCAVAVTTSLQGCRTGGGNDATVKDDVSADGTFVATMNQSKGLIVRVPEGSDASLSSAEVRAYTGDASLSSSDAPQAFEAAMKIDGYGELVKEAPESTDTSTASPYYNRWRYTYYTYTWTYTYYTWYYYTPGYYYYYYPIYYY